MYKSCQVVLVVVRLSVSEAAPHSWLLCCCKCAAPEPTLKWTLDLACCTTRSLALYLSEYRKARSDWLEGLNGLKRLKGLIINMISHRGHNWISSALTILDSALTS